MNFKEFEYCIEKLKSVYGASRYPQQRTSILWQAVQDLPREFLGTAIDALIMAKANAPMPSEILEVLRPAINDAAEQKKKALLKTLPSCMTCDNSGVIFSTEIDLKQRYAFQCSCPRGALLYPAYPRLQNAINPKSPNLTAEDEKAIEGLKAFLADPRASLFRRLP